MGMKTHSRPIFNSHNKNIISSKYLSKKKLIFPI